MLPAVRPSPTSATLAPHLVRYLAVLAREYDVPFEPVLRAAGLTPEAVDAPALRVSFRQGRVIIERSLEAFGLPDLGLLVGLRQPITCTGLLGLGMLASARVGDAVDLGVRFQALAGSMVHWTAHREGAMLAVVPEVFGGSAAVDEFLIDEELASITRSARDATSPTFTPHHVELRRSEPRDVAAYVAAFGERVTFGAARDAWVLAPEQWDAPIATADPWALGLATGLLDVEAAEVVDRQELVALLAARVADALPEVLPLAEHARSLAMSERTLRRRLADVAASYSDVVDEVRRRTVERALRRTETSLADLAAAVGYADERSLRRAVRRWHGVSPAQLRELPAAAAGGEVTRS